MPGRWFRLASALRASPLWMERKSCSTDEVDQAFVDATLRLLADAELRRRIGAAARAKVLAEYSWQAQVRKMESIYEELGASSFGTSTSTPTPALTEDSGDA